MSAWGYAIGRPMRRVVRVEIEAHDDEFARRLYGAWKATEVLTCGHYGNYNFEPKNRRVPKRRWCQMCFNGFLPGSYCWEDRRGRGREVLA
jgi:hypothetical protein